MRAPVMLRAIVRWIAGRVRRPYRTIIVQDVLPPALSRGTVYIVEEDGFREQAAMLCPCRCGEVLHLNLLPDERPCWRATVDLKGAPTLHPSVWRRKGCGSHFWLRRGRVQWCGED